MGKKEITHLMLKGTVKRMGGSLYVIEEEKEGTYGIRLDRKKGIIREQLERTLLTEVSTEESTEYRREVLWYLLYGREVGEFINGDIVVIQDGTAYKIGKRDIVEDKVMSPSTAKELYVNREISAFYEKGNKIGELKYKNKKERM